MQISDHAARRRSDLLSFATLAMLGCYLSVYQDAIADMQAEFHISGAVSGFLISLHFIASLTSPLLLGTLADRFGRKPVFRVTFGMVLTGMLLLVLGRSVWLLGAGIFIIGMGFCAMESSMSSLLSQTHPGRETQVINLSQMYFGLAAVAGPLLSNYLQQWTGEWRTAYVLLLVLMVGCSVLLQFCRLPDPPPREKAEKGAFGKLLGSGFYWFLLASMLIYVGVEQGAAFWIEFYTEEVGGSVPPAWYLSAYWLGMSVCRWIASRRDLSGLGFQVAGLAIGAAGFGITLFWHSEAAMILLYALVGFGIATVWPWIMSMGTAANPACPDTAAGGISTAGAIGGSVLLYSLGSVMDWGGPAASVTAVFGLIATQTLMFAGLWLVRRKRKL